MLIRLGYDIEFNIPQPVAIVALLNVHPSREADLREPDILHIEPAVSTEQYFDRFGNRCTRFLAPQGKLRLWNSTLVQDYGEKDAVNYSARQHPVLELPVDNLTYLLNSRYCEVDRMSNIAAQLFGGSDRRSGMSLTKVARQHRVSRATVCRLMKEIPRGSQEFMGAEVGCVA